MKRLALLTALLCAAFLALAGGASAATFNVTTTDDDIGSCDVTDCSLREAIDAADSNSTDDTINVPPGHYTLVNGELDISGSEDPGALTIIGANARNTIVDAAGGSRVFNIDFGLVVNISHLTITGGNADQGGGIFNEGVLTLDSSGVDGNTAVGDTDFGGQGGGIFNDHTITVTNSSVSRNIADGAGNSFSGGQGGGIFNNDQGDFTNVTVSGNQAKPAPGATFPDGQGGGIFANDVTNLTNVTIAGNTSSGASDNAAGGIFINDDVTFKNTIVATNSVGGAENNCVVNSTFHDGGHNLEGANDCTFNLTGDLRNTNPLLGTLGDNGGESDTQALLSGSPAIDTADAANCPATDQRGVTRPQFAGCDIGAFEAQQVSAPPPPPPAPSPSAPADTTKPTVSVAGVRRACVSSSTLAIRVHASDASGVKSVRVTLDGKRLRIRSRTSFTLRIDVRKLKPGRHVLRITTTDAAGNTTTTRRTITRCAKRAAKPRRRVAPRFTG